MREVMHALRLPPDTGVLDLAPGELAGTLLADTVITCAVVALPKLVILDEVFSGMTRTQVDRVTA